MQQAIDIFKLLAELSLPHLAILLSFSAIGLAALAIWVVFSITRRRERTK